MPQPPEMTQQQADALVRLSILHAQQQVGKVATTQTALRSLWSQVLDPSDIAGSYSRFTLGASYLIQQARRDAMPVASGYYRDSQEIAGFATRPRALTTPQSMQADITSLYVTGFITIQKQIKDGASQDFAIGAGQAAMLRAAQRRILDAPRQSIIARAQEEDETVGWSRVSDGHPCYFCAMLVSRGPVYSAQTVDFRAHDGCGCGSKMVFANDPSRGWTDQSRILRAHYDENRDNWRSAYNKAMQDPESPVARAFRTAPRADYGLAA